MSSITITNADEDVVVKYGKTFTPGQKREIDIEVLQTYSLMEISRALQYIVKYMPRREPTNPTPSEPTRIHTVLDDFLVRDTLHNLSTPYIIRRFEEWRTNRRRRKSIQGRK